MTEQMPYAIGDRVRVFLDPSRWRTAGWVYGTVIRIDGYSAHRSFHWIELDLSAEPLHGRYMSVISVLNPKHLRSA